MADMRIYVVDLESVPTRYTCEWKAHLPALLRSKVKEAGLNIKVINISGGRNSIQATPGAFLNFQATNIYKNNQLSNIAKRFTSEVKSGDKFVFVDAWHTGILQLKYMSELLGIPVEIHALWHAGSYDPQDFLGRLIKDKRWTYSTERALYHAVDYNWVATEFHANLFMNTLFPDGKNYDGVYHTGWPMEYMPKLFEPYANTPKEDLIIFPHRIAPEKQPEIFRDLAASMPEYKFIVCQDNKLEKAEYHKLLAKSKIMWSANLQETLGISPFEGALLGVYPLLPDRLSYSEMYTQEYLYPSKWTESFDAYKNHKTEIMSLIKTHMELDSSDYVKSELAPHLLENYFSATSLIKKLLS
jgi:glycosyltransferase involved in cell wall biosynthesis